MTVEPVREPSRTAYGRVRELPESERPRERLTRLGPQALTSAELLAILLNTGTAAEDVLQLASRLLADRGGLRGLAASDLATCSPRAASARPRPPPSAPPSSWVAASPSRATTFVR